MQNLMLLAVAWVVLMLIWLIGGVILTWDGSPRCIVLVVVPWVCVVSLGLVIFGFR